MNAVIGPRRGRFIQLAPEHLDTLLATTTDATVTRLESFDLLYRSLCAMLFNYVPMSGHPGGSISAGRIMAALLLESMDYDVGDPLRDDADMISFAAGHKTLGLYAMWALRDEALRIAAPDALPNEANLRLRLEDLLGFRRNPITQTPLFRRFGVKPLDGHPTPATPFVRLSTGASGVGVASSLGLAFGALDYYGDAAPWVHVVEGEGGMTPGRVAETMASSGTSRLRNAILHVDWNQASIDSERVCRDGDAPGDYVQWTPAELAYLHDWNVIEVADGLDFRQVIAAQKLAMGLTTGQPTAIVYRTVKGWQYGIEGKASHGAGHKLCCTGFYEALRPLTEKTGAVLPSCHGSDQPAGAVDTRCRAGSDAAVVEGCFWEALSAIRSALEADRPLAEFIAGRVLESRDRLNAAHRVPRNDAPRIEAIYELAAKGDTAPEALALEPGKKATLRGQLGKVLAHYNEASNGAVMVGAADLAGSTSIGAAGKGFPGGFLDFASNPGSRTMSVGGICEDAMTGILSGMAAFGKHTGAGASYGAFSAPLGHIAARLHAIGNQARQAVEKGPYRPFFIVCAHAGVKTGEDGPTHADPQALQLYQGNFPDGTMVTLTPWDPQEVWPLVAAALRARPAVIAPYVTRPDETVPDRAGLGLAPAEDAAKGVYKLCTIGQGGRTLVLQGSDAGFAFVEGALPRLRAAGVDLDVFYVASAELFDRLPEAERAAIYPEERAREAMGITGFTLPTMDRWVRSDAGRKATLHPFRAGHFLGSGKADMVLAEAKLDGESQFEAITAYLDASA